MNTFRYLVLKYPGVIYEGLVPTYPDEENGLMRRLLLVL